LVFDILIFEHKSYLIIDMLQKYDNKQNSIQFGKKGAKTNFISKKKVPKHPFLNLLQLSNAY